jgi:4-aminobutyrate aminotransferase
VLGEGGYVPAPNHRHNYLARLRELCDRHDILLIADEVQSGVGRTGKWFAVEQYGVVPDVLIFAKGLANGLPIGGYAVRRYLSGVQPPGSHGSTFGGNPVACAAALKTLETIETERLLARVTELGERAMDMLRQRTTATVRGYGFMIGLELDSEDASQRVMQGMYQRGILILPAGKQGLRFIPPLNVPEDLFWYALDALCEEIES